MLWISDTLPTVSPTSYGVAHHMFVSCKSFLLSYTITRVMRGGYDAAIRAGTGRLTYPEAYIFGMSSPSYRAREPRLFSIPRKYGITSLVHP